MGTLLLFSDALQLFFFKVSLRKTENKTTHYSVIQKAHQLTQQVRAFCSPHTWTYMLSFTNSTEPHLTSSACSFSSTCLEPLPSVSTVTLGLAAQAGLRFHQVPLLDKNGVSRESLHNACQPSFWYRCECAVCAVHSGPSVLHLRRQHTPPSGLAGCQHPFLSLLLKKVF